MLSAMLGQFNSVNFMRFTRPFAMLASILIASAGMAQQPTSTALAISSGGASVSTVKQGTLITLTATVTAGGVPVTTPGQVEFCVAAAPPLRCTDIRVLATVQLLPSGTATYKFYPGPGTHTYEAIFLGTHLAAGSTSPTQQLDVTPYVPTTTFVSATGTGADYTLTATVVGTGGISPPTGSFTFTDESNSNYVLGSAPAVPASLGSSTSFVNLPLDLTTIAAASLNATDFNGDGYPDLLWTWGCTTTLGVNGGGINLWLGNGDGTFTPVSPIQTQISLPGLCYASVPVADFNMDGKPDFVAATLTEVSVDPASNSAGSLNVFLGNGDGTFKALPPMPDVVNANYGAPFAVGDFNNDGIPDLVVVTSLGSESTLQFGMGTGLTTLLGNGDGTFTVGPQTLTGQMTYLETVGDFNNDGILDLIVYNIETQTTNVMLGKGDGTFTTPGIVIPSGGLAADFNGDGILDLISSTGNYPNIVVTYLQGNGDGSFAAPVTISSGVWQPIAIVDMNQDGKPDIVAYGGYGNQVGVLFGNGDGTFTAPAPYPVLGNAASGLNGPEFVAVADFNGDGLPDMAFNVGTIVGGVFDILLSEHNPQISTAVLTTPLVGSTDHTVEASYPGDAQYRPSSDTISLLAAQVPTTLTLAASPAGSNYGQPVTLTATISPSTPQQDHVPTGTVTFSNGSTVVGTSPVSNGAATFTTSLLPTGTASITAAYSGDTNFTASTSASTSVTVTGYGSTTGLTVTPNPASVGQTVTLSAAVAPVGAGYSSGPTGTVSFYDGAKQIGQVALDASGHAVFATSALAIGSHVLTASYSGDAAYYASSSAATTLVVNILADATALTVSPNPAGLGQPVTLSAEVAGTGFGSATTPSGTITFYDGGAALATGALDATGHAVYTTSALTLGTHSLTAVYSGSAVFAGSTSVAVAEIVVKADFSIALSSPTITLQTYQHTTTTVTLASLGNFTDNLAVSCGDLPAYVTCIFTPNPATLAGNSTATVSFYLDTDSILGGDGLNGPVHGSRRLPPLTIGLALLFLPLGLMQATGKRRRRQMPQLMLTVSVIALIVSLGGCGTSQITPVPSAAPGTYTIPITATGATSGATHTAQLELIVQP